MHEEDIALNRRMGSFGAGLLGERVLTHCNAGALATAGYGTALGVIRAAVEQGKKIQVFADETRPFLQGARLTAWELQKDHIPVTLITDNMAGYFMQQGKIDCVVVGADRIAANGDVANKIGTYSVAVLAKENNIPFYVAAPISTLDLSLPSGDHIPIEQRPSREVTHIQQSAIAPEGVQVANPAFDVTPNRYVTAIITERGVATSSLRTKLEGALNFLNPTVARSWTFRLALAKVEEKNPIADACFVGCTGQLKRHEATVSGDDRVGSLASFIVIEVRKPLKVLPSPVEAELPDVDIARPMLATQCLDLTIRFHQRVFPVGQDSFHLVVSSRSL